MPLPTFAGSWRPLLAACLLAPVLAACSGDPAPPATSPSPSLPSSSAPVTSPAPSSTGSSESSAAPGTTAKPKPSTPPAAPVEGSCGTVTAASGLTLQVLGGQAGGVDCGQATTLVKAFHQQIAGKQNAESNEPVNATVDGWLCTSGPPAAQGGTTCSKGDQTVFAAVVPNE